MAIDEAGIASILTHSRTIAVVGMSPRPERASHQVARYLIAVGYRVIPVNPGPAEILGLRCYPNLREVPERVDIVDCFRRSTEILHIAEDAIAIGAKVLWFQLGVVNEEAARKAEAAGLMVVRERCIKVDHAVLRIGSRPQASSSSKVS